MRIFWRSRRQKLTAERGVSESQLNECLDKVVDYLDREGRQDFPAMLVESFPGTIDAIKSLHLVHCARAGTLKFAHQSFLDYLVAERVLRESLDRGTSPLEWLRTHDQSLFRREQLRQLLVLLREEVPDQYTNLLRQLLHDEGVRFHLRHLALSILRSVEAPTDDEFQLLRSLLTNHEWRRHALRYVVLGHGGWMQRCQDAHVFRDWLNSGNEEVIGEALWMFRTTPRSHRHLIDEALASFLSSDDPAWGNRIDGILPLEISDDTDALFEWRCQRVRKGAIQGELYGVESAAKDYPLRVTRLLEAEFQRRIDITVQPQRTEQDGKPQQQSFERFECSALLKHLEDVGVEGWDCLLPVMVRSVAVTRTIRVAHLRQQKKKDSSSLFFLTDKLWESQRALQKINTVLRRVLTQIGRKIALNDFARLSHDCSKLDLKRSKALNRLVCDVFHGAPADHADAVLHWLLADPRRIHLGIVGDRLGTNTLGFRWSGVHNLLLSAGELATDEWNASRSTDEESAEKALKQFVWCLPVAPSKGNETALEVQALTRRVSPLPRNILPLDTEHLTAAIDLGKYLTHWVVVAWSPGATGVVVDYGRIEVACQDLGLEQALLVALREFREQINQGWSTDPASNPNLPPRQMIPEQVFVDAGYMTDVVYAFCRESGERFRPSVGRGTTQRRTQWYNRPTKTGSVVKHIGEGYHFNWLPNEQLYLAEVDSDHWKSWVHQRLVSPLSHTGALRLFNAPPNDHLSLAKHLTAERKTEEFVTGKGLIVRWEPIRRQNHWLDALYNACAAGHFTGVRLINEVVREAPPQPPPIPPDWSQIYDQARWQEMSSRLFGTRGY